MKIKKNLFICVTLFLLLTVSGILANGDIIIYVNEQKIQCEEKPYIENGRTMVPMRKVFEALNAEVDWDENTKTITAIKESKVIKLQIDNPVLYNNGVSETLDVAPIIVNNVTFVPLRAVAQSMNASVDWNGYINTVYIDSPVIKEKERSASVIMYAPDGRTLNVKNSEVEAYQNVGWYTKPVTTVYALGSKTLVIYKDELDDYLNVGWYTKPVITVYAPDGRTLIIYKDELSSYLKVGWYSTYDEAQKANKAIGSAGTKEQNANKQSEKNISVTEKTSHQEHSAWAEEGAVLESVDPLTGVVRYKEKCPVCGKVGNGAHTTSISGSRYTSHGTCKNSKCSNWGKSFNIVIGHKTTTVYD